MNVFRPSWSAKRSAPGTVAGGGVGQRQIEVRDVAVLLVEARQDLPAHPQVQRELRRDLEVVLHIEVEIALVVAVLTAWTGRLEVCTAPSRKLA